MRRSSTHSPSDGGVFRPRSGPSAEPASTTTSSALWCTRNTGSAAALSAGARNVGRTSSTSPTCATASADAAADGGDRFDSAAPGTPTALAGHPRTSSAANAPAPTANSAAPHDRPSPRRAANTPSCHGTHHTATTFTHPTSTATRAAGTATPHHPTRASSGVSADSTTCTTRNHSGVTTRYPTVHTVCCGAPRTDSPNRTSAHTPSSTATGTTSRRARRHHGVAERAAPNPPAKKNSPSAWSTHVAGASSGTHRSGLSTTRPSSVSTGAVTSQCPSTTATTAIARVASTTRSRLTAAPPPRSAPPPAARPTRG